MKRNFVIGAMLVVVVGIMIYASRRSPGSGIVGSGGNQIAPNFTLSDLSGKTVQLSDFRGKAVVLNFWATWCPPCKAEIPWFIDLQKKYGSQGLQIIGVSMDAGGKGVVEPFVREMGINYKVLIGTSDVSDLYGGVQALPTTFYIGRAGRILEYVPGLIGHHDMEENIRAALATPAGNAPIAASNAQTTATTSALSQ